MAKKDIFGDDIETKHEEQSFAAMFENANTSSSRRLTVGQEIRGEILAISKEEAFVSTGSPTDGIILVKDLLDENKVLKYKVGDFIDVIVVSLKNGEVRLSRKGSKNTTETDSLEDAFDMEIPVEGRVTEICNGGFRVSIQGKTAFCPISQIDLKFVKDGTDYVDKKFDFMITQFENKGRNIVVSRRKVLELQRAESEGTFMLKHKTGDILSGLITRLESFGAFVELESGIEGLVHISEIGWSRVQHPSEVVRTGQKVEVKLLKVEEVDAKLKISLSIKQAGGEGDPWLMVPQKYPVGSRHTGKVEKKENYGLFVNIGPGVIGLLPRSKWRDSTEAQQFENKKRGDEVLVQIDQIIFEEKKLSLGLPQEAEDLSWKSHTATSAGKGLGTLGDQLQALVKKS